MKKLLIALAAVLVTAASYAQGSVTFNTRVPGGIDAPVVLPGTTTGVGPSYNAALYLVSGGTATLVPSSVTTFRAGAGAAYVVPVVAQIPGVPGGASATLRIRAWETAAGSWDAASAPGSQWGFGESSDVTVTLTEPPNLPPNLPATPGFAVTIVPEPSTLALGALGAAALLFRRRK